MTYTFFSFREIHVEWLGPIADKYFTFQENAKLFPE